MFCKNKSKPLWYNRLASSYYLTEEEKLFLSYYSQEGFTNLFPYWFLCQSDKLYVKNSVMIVMHWINTGEWKYIPFTDKAKIEDYLLKIN